MELGLDANVVRSGAQRIEFQPFPQSTYNLSSSQYAANSSLPSAPPPQQLYLATNVSRVAPMAVSQPQAYAAPAAAAAAGGATTAGVKVAVIVAVVCIVALLAGGVVGVVVIVSNNNSGSDSANSNDTSTTTNSSSCPEYKCPSSGKCIPNSYVCDNIVDCENNEDENQCAYVPTVATEAPSATTTTTTAAGSAECNAAQFHCVNGVTGSSGICIPSSWKCDNATDCVGGTDEADCDDDDDGGGTGGGTNTTDGEFSCLGSTTKILKGQVCDGTENCPGGTDEDRCIIASNGYNGGMIKVFSVTTNSHYYFCGAADGWTTAKSNAVCQYLGFPSSASTTDMSWSGTGIASTATTFDLASLVQQGTVNSCTNNKVAQITCTAPTTSCGTTNKNARVVGGTNAPIEDYPWQISLQSNSGSAFCGGTIVSERWVVSAAHCVDDIPSTSFSYYRVVAGKSNLTETTSGSVHVVDKIVYHPLYSSTTNDMDIAVIHVTTDLVFSSKIQPACLPTPSQKFPDETPVIATGWGDTSFGGSSSDILQSVTLPLHNTASCPSTFPNMASSILPGMICAGQQAGGIDTCQGDSGGPLVAARDSAFYVIGATSFGIGCALPGFPGVYAEVSYIVNWIKREMNKVT